MDADKPLRWTYEKYRVSDSSTRYTVKAGQRVVALVPDEEDAGQICRSQFSLHRLASELHRSQARAQTLEEENRLLFAALHRFEGILLRARAPELAQARAELAAALRRIRERKGSESL